MLIEISKDPHEDPHEDLHEDLHEDPHEDPHETIYEVVNKLNKDGLIVIQNQLIDFGYDMKFVENGLIKAVLSCINKDETEFRLYRVKITEFINVAGKTDKNITRDVRTAIDGIMGRQIRTITVNPETGKETYKYINWVSCATYTECSGYVDIKLNNDLALYLLNIDKKKGFTKFFLHEYYGFRHPRSFRLYEILKRWAIRSGKTQQIQPSHKIFTIDQIRELFDIQDNYPLYGDIKKRILKPATEDIKKNGKKNPFYFTYEEIKENKKVIAIKFHIIPKAFQRSENEIDDKNHNDELNVQMEASDNGFKMLKIDLAIINPLLPRIEKVGIDLEGLQNIAEKIYQKGYENVFCDIHNSLFFETILVEIENFIKKQKNQNKEINANRIFYRAISERWGIPKTNFELEQLKRKAEEKAALKEKILAAERMFDNDSNVDATITTEGSLSQLLKKKFETIPKVDNKEDEIVAKMVEKIKNEDEGHREIDDKIADLKRLDKEVLHQVILCDTVLSAISKKIGFKKAEAFTPGTLSYRLIKEAYLKNSPSV